MENKDYPGKILHGHYSQALKAHVTENIRRLAAFDKTSMPVIPYLSAWQEQENTMWYEFAGNRFSDLMGCPAADLADVFRQCIVERRVYDYQGENHTRINQQTLRQSELPGFRKGLREQGEKRGHVEAIYKVQLPNGEVAWLKDQATVTAFKQDQVHVSSGCLTLVTKEMEAEEALREAQQLLREKARALNLAKKIQEENAARLSIAIKQVEAARKEAEKANKAKSEFLAVISHEIRNPMNGIVGTCDLIMADDLSRQQKEYLEIIRSSAFSLLGLINDILDFSKIEAGKLEFQEVPFDVRDIVEEVSDIFLEMITRKDLELIVDIGPDVPEKVIADPMRLRQVLINLISNALKFTRQGEIIIRVEPVRRENSVIELGFRVTDTGIGIAPEHFDHLFESFTQINGTRTREYGGTGLGLAICRQIVEMMNGTIGVDSYPGQGSTFYFNVPLKFKKNSEKYGARTSAVFKPCHVLIAMKNRSGRQALGQLLESWGFHVTACGSASRAVDLFCKPQQPVPYSLVIMDMGLADIEEPGLSNNLKTMAASVDLSIALIRMGKNADLNQSEGLGFTQSLTKPVKQSILKNVVQTSFGDADRVKTNPAATQKTAPSFTNTRILLVEDNPINVKIGSEMLRMAGVAVDTAQNGLEAIEKVQKQNYAAVLIDIQMPHLDGIEASRIIRRQFSKTRLPIIAMSAHAKAENWKACLEAGINDYILKPISRNVLFTALKNQIGPGHKLSVPESDLHSRQTAAYSNGDTQALPGLDIKEGLERLGGEALIYADILSDFCETYTGFHQEMEELISRSEFKRAADLSHSLKGASGNVSATGLFEHVKALEQACRQKKEQAARLLLGSVQSEYKTVCLSAEQFCDQVRSKKTIDNEKSSVPARDAPANEMATLAGFLMDSLDQCDPVLSEALVQKMASQIQERWKKEMDQLKDAVKNYQFDDARKCIKILMEKAGVWK
jgi:signal transduction histidine kinase/DNA-binding response OmpR family regulator